MPLSSSLVTTLLEHSSEIVFNQPSENVLLLSAIIYARSHVGVYIPSRALLNSGSQLNFITTRLANQLQI